MASSPANPSQPIRVEYGVSMSTDDGTRLVSDIYHPPGAGPHPVLLMRQPYGREIASTVVYAQPEYFARAGFLVVIQDVRGRGDSDGQFEAFQNEASDGRQTIRWAAALPDADGRVCMYGFSYQAYTQLAVLDDPPEALVAIAPHMAAAELYSGWFYRQGMLRLATTASWANQMLREDAWRRGAEASAQALEAAYTENRLVQQLPLNAIDPITREDLPSYAKDWLTHSNDDAYWQSIDCSEALAKSKVPAFHLGGLYDYYLRGTVDAYTCRESKKEDFFLLAPWKHIPWESSMLGLDLGDECRIDTDALLVDWFNSKLGRSRKTFEGVRYFLLGANQWTNAPTWPPPADTIEYFLHSGGHANSRFGDGRLNLDRPEDQPADHFVYDPEVPVLAPGGMIPAWGPIDLSAQQQGNNLLVFDSEPIASETTFVGEPSLHLWVDSSVEATAFVARISWLKPDGSARFISLGAAAFDAAERDATTGAAEPDGTTDGTTDATTDRSHGAVRLRLDFDPVALTLSKGDALRLDLSSSAFPLLARHPNTRTPAEKVPNPSHFQRARQTIFHDPIRSSSLRMPCAAAQTTSKSDE